MNPQELEGGRDHAHDKHDKHEHDHAQELAIEELADFVLEVFKDEPKDGLEPFEQYREKVKSHLVHKEEDFKSRFANGYRTLLQEFTKKG